MDQIDRTNRYLYRIREIYQGAYSTSNDKEAYEDDVISFFMHCYHIRDWILHLNKVGITEEELDSFIDDHYELRICADLCNGSKHCKLVRKTRSGRQPHIVGKTYSATTWATNPGRDKFVKASYTILTSTGIVDALSLAEKCMSLWTDFVEQARKGSLNL